MTSTLNLPPAAGVTSLAGPANVWARLARLRDTTPGILKIFIALLLGFGLLAGAAVELAATSAASGTQQVGERTEPLLINAETIYSSLADADATAASAFLAGGLEPPTLTARYNDDLARADTALAEAASRAPTGSRAAASVAKLAAGVSRYAGLVATARANNRQGYPVGAAYLSTASALNRTELLPEAQTLFRTAQAELAGGYATARSDTVVAALFVTVVALLVALLVTQRYLSRHTKRTFNVPLVAATMATLVLGGWAAATFALQHHHLSMATTQGSAPIDTLAQARILALQERGDEGLTLAARGSGAAYETDFVTVSRQLAGPTGTLARATAQVGNADQAKLRAAAAAHQSYLAQHAQVRKLDDAGSSDAAVALALGPQTTGPYTTLTDRLGEVLTAKKATFTTEINDAAAGLGLLRLFGPVLALIVCGLAFVGVRARLEEYR